MDAWLGIKSKTIPSASTSKPVSPKKGKVASTSKTDDKEDARPAPSKAKKAKGSPPPVRNPVQTVGPIPRFSVEEKRTIDPTAVPWVEKYRPKTIEDVSAQDHTIKVLRKTLESANLPHMLFYGPPGTGKTSTILALSKQLFGPKAFRSRVLELNASDERGISVVREKIKNFARIAVSQADPDYPCPPYKIIILDEADSMTQDAQSALRRIMENYSKITRFCLICNYVTRIIEPITSRCSKFRFKPLDNSNALQRLQTICAAESVNVGTPALESLIRISEGDLRRAITFLQSASKLAASGSLAKGEDEDMGVESAATEISEASVLEIGGVVPDGLMAELAEALGVGAEEKKTTFEGVQKAVTKVVREGYSATQVLSQLHDHLILNPELPSRVKASIALTLGEADKMLGDGADEELQLLNVALQVRNAVMKG